MGSRMMSCAVALGVALFANLALAEPMKGRILGEQCAKLNKIGECYLKWADPMVFWTPDGDYYRIVLAGTEVDQTALDKAYGLEVEVDATILDNGPGKATIQFSKLTVLNPPGKKQFFKG